MTKLTRQQQAAAVLDALQPLPSVTELYTCPYCKTCEFALYERVESYSLTRCRECRVWREWRRWCDVRWSYDRVNWRRPPAETRVVRGGRRCRECVAYLRNAGFRVKGAPTVLLDRQSKRV